MLCCVVLGTDFVYVLVLRASLRYYWLVCRVGHSEMKVVLVACRYLVVEWAVISCDVWLVWGGRFVVLMVVDTVAVHHVAVPVGLVWRGLASF